MIPGSPDGLSEEDARLRAEQGQSNVTRDQSSRSLAEILRANVLTRFNALLGSMLVVILVVGPLQDAVFGLILLANLLIGVTQEIRAKVTLDRLSLLNAAQARVIREGHARSVPVRQVVIGDLLELQRGDELPVDGLLESADGLELNEALLTGESEPVLRNSGDEVQAGSFVSSGRGRYRATRVGEACRARRMTVEARRYQLLRSELMHGINQILRVVTWIIVPVGTLLVVSQLRANPSLPDALRASVAGVVTLVPEGLVLLTSAALALAIIRLGRRRVIIKQLPAVEMLARTDMLCLDKTGTLTNNDSVLERVDGLSPTDQWEDALAGLVHDDPEATVSVRTLAAAYPQPPSWAIRSRVRFSSSRKWSSVTFDEKGSWVLGAPEVLLAASPQEAELRPRLEALAAGGGRVLLFARASNLIAEDRLAGLKPSAIVVLRESLRAEARSTLERLREQGMAVKVISGDNPATVAAIAAALGLEVGRPVDGRTLPGPGSELNMVAETSTIFGRVTPEQKRDLVAALRAQGHTVTMMGDGVNDVLGLKAADLGVAIGTASPAARTVAAVVIPDGSFASLPPVLAEGRRLVANVERLASLYFTKTVYALLMALAVVLAALPFPFLPRQLTLVSAFTIGIPSVVLVLAPSLERVQSGFMRRVLAFAVPSGLVAAAASFAAYLLAVRDADVTLGEERTIATLVMAAVGLWILARLARPLTTGRRLLLWLLTAGLIVVVGLPPSRAFFDLDLPRAIVLLAAIGVVALALVALEAGDRAGGLAIRASSRIRRAAGPVRQAKADQDQ